MTYIIGDACIDVKDISCQSVCPVDCIHETDRMLVIDAEECIDCGACEPECPVEAILPEDAIPADWEPFVRSTTPSTRASSRSSVVEEYADAQGLDRDNPGRS
jgi:NAD-dependent dihydropyrimidine dehydrogenase PreA subunit